MSPAVDNDMKFMGETTHPGGQFRDIAVVGRARMDGDVTCRSFSCMGEAQLRGALQSGRTSIMGQTRADGPVDAGDLNVMGQMDCEATLRVRKLSCMGKLKVRGRMDAETVRVFGQLVVQGDCNVDDFHSRGAFEIDGLLSVDNLVVQPYGPCRAGEIGGARIEVRRRGGVLGRIPLVAWVCASLFGHHGPRLEAQCIEGDDLILEDTVAKMVRGARIRIGRGCRIDAVEYRETYSCGPESVVGESRQI
jgi:cytoskeletal protein CcmA (bactofilin family)